MSRKCNDCVHCPICEWCAENSEFKMPETADRCGMYHTEEKTQHTEEDRKQYIRMRCRARIGMIAYIAAMFIYPFADRTVYGFPIWVVGWVATIIGWWCIAPSVMALMQTLDENIREVEEQNGKEGNQGT